MNEKLLIAMIANIEGLPTPEEWAELQHHAKRLTAQNVTQLIQKAPKRVMKAGIWKSQTSNRLLTVPAFDDVIGIR